MRCCGTDTAPFVAISSTRPHPAPACDKHRRPWLGRITTLISWTLSLVPLILMPKCPACVAAYILLFTGIGLSFSTAAAIRWTLLTLCLALSAFLIHRALRPILKTHV